MPKNLNYPLASFQKSYLLTESVDALGGSCSIQECAKKMQRKLSGGFMAVISSAQKFSLIFFERGIITISENYKLIKNSNFDNEKLQLLKKAFLTPQLFSILYTRFKGQELSNKALNKILIDEFNIEENTAGRVASYFVNGLKAYGLLDGNIVLTDSSTARIGAKTGEIIEEYKQNSIISQSEKISAINPGTSFTTKKTESYELQISGSAISIKINMEDEADLLIAEAILNKIRKGFKID